MTFSLLRTAREMEDLASWLRSRGAAALDTEADSLYHYFEKICLIQISSGGRHFVIDPLAGEDLKPLLAALAEKPLILHGADYDLRMLRRSFGFIPRGSVFDTMLAAKLLGYENIGLASLVMRHFGAELPKRGRKSDWSRRPLSAAQLSYASDDTRYLEPLAERLRAELDGKGREAWHRESCEAMVRAAMESEVQGDEEAWRIKGTSALDPRQMAFAREIWRWREAEAQRADLPPFKILMNERLVELAIFASAHDDGPTPEDFKLPRSCEGRRRRELLAAIGKARGLKRDEWPVRRRSERQRLPPAELFVPMQAELKRVAHIHGLEPSTIAPRSAIAMLARAAPSDIEEMMAKGGLLRWQAELLRPGFANIFAARGAQGFGKVV